MAVEDAGTATDPSRRRRSRRRNFVKYIVIDNSETGRVPYFCVAPVTHAVLARLLRAAGVIVSAGFVEFLEGGKVRVYGRSESLNLGPAVGDAELIEAMARFTRQIGERES